MNSNTIFFFDTCALLNLGERVINEEPFMSSECYLSSKTLEEIENIKVSQNKSDEIKYKARVVSRMITANPKAFEVIISGYTTESVLETYSLPLTPDNIIVATAYEINRDNRIVRKDKNFIFVSDDLNCNITASKVFGLTTEMTFADEEEPLYKGYVEYHFKSDDELAKFYGNLEENSLGIYTNEYALLYDKNNELVDKVVWTGEKYEKVSYKSINNDFMGRVKPRNVHQELAFNLLQNNEIPIKVLQGRFGSGKDFLMIANAIQLLKQNKFDKLIWVRNNVEVKNTNPIGFLPNSMEDKLMPFCSPLIDHIGGKSGLEMFMNQGKIEIQHLGFIRGRDIRNSIIYCSESENMTTEHIQLLLGRVGEGSALWLNGDFKQTDDKVFERNNGFRKIIDRLKGNSLFGVVQLEKTERSKTAALADLLD